MTYRAALTMKKEDFSAGSLEADPRWQLIQRIVATPGFARSARLSDILLYVCRQTLIGRGAGLNEQTIGETVLGRAVGYDPRDDNIVRAHASRLRVRLGSYFHEEGAGETLRVSIPRGSYVPLFEKVEAEPLAESPAKPPVEALTPEGATPECAEGKLPTAAAPVRSIWPSRWILLVCLLVTATAVTISVMLVYRRSEAAPVVQKTPMNKLWSEMFTRSRDTLIVPADTSLVLAQLIDGHSVDLADYASGGYKADLKCEGPCDQRLLQEVESRRYTSMADLQFAVALARVPEFISDRTRIRYVRDLQLTDLMQSNVILSGSLVADPWLNLIEHRMNFILHDDPTAGPLRVENIEPKGNEPREYLYHEDDPQHRGLATIAFLPSLSGDGNMLIVQGFTLAGTQAAGDFVTIGKDFDKLFPDLTNNNSPLPHFEIVLETMDVNGIASHPSVLAWRTYP